MKTLSINLVFWTDGVENSTRDRNAKYSAKELKNLSDYLQGRGIDCTYQIFDYSPAQIIEDSTHIPYPVSVFKKSEKINNVLNDCHTDLFAVMDSDCFVCREDYEKLADILLSVDNNCCITFDVLDFTEEDTQKIIYGDVSPSDLAKNVSSRFPGRAGGLGAFYITNTQNLKDHKGFNLNYTAWGGEDGEIYDKIYRDGSIQKIPCNNEMIKLYHLSHFSDRENINYFNREEYIKNNY